MYLLCTYLKFSYFCFPSLLSLQIQKFRYVVSYIFHRICLSNNREDWWSQVFQQIPQPPVVELFESTPGAPHRSLNNQLSWDLLGDNLLCLSSILLEIDGITVCLLLSWMISARMEKPESLTRAGRCQAWAASLEHFRVLQGLASHTAAITSMTVSLTASSLPN